jgi:putative phosphoesterase
VSGLRSADLIVHAGDFTTLALLRELEAYGPVAAVHGNIDEPELRQGLPATAEIDLGGGVRLGLIHDAGPRRGRLERLRRRFPDAEAVVFGHSHIPLHETAADGFQIFNPGSPTDRRRSPRHTMGIAETAEGRISFKTIALD